MNKVEMMNEVWCKTESKLEGVENMLDVIGAQLLLMSEHMPVAKLEGISPILGSLEMCKNIIEEARINAATEFIYITSDGERKGV